MICNHYPMKVTNIRLIRGLMMMVLLVTIRFQAQAAELNVYAAASLSDVFKELSPVFEQQTHDKLVFNFGASSLLARQIEEGAPADLFFSADEAKMDTLEKKGLILKETRLDRLSNTLVIVVAAESGIAVKSPQDLAGAQVKRIALADPKAVPAGIYAREYLTKIKLWSNVEPKVIPTDNVRAALAAVESGNVETDMVYRTDAAISKKVKIAYEISPQDGPVIRYPMAVIKESKQPDAAKRLWEFLKTPAAGKVFEKNGFIVLPLKG